MAAVAQREQQQRSTLPGLVRAESDDESDDEDEDEFDASPDPEPRTRSTSGAFSPASGGAQQPAPGARPGATAAPNTGMLARRGSMAQSLSSSVQQFNEAKNRKRRARRLSLQQQFDFGDKKDTVEKVKDLLLPGSKTRTLWELLMVVAILFQFILSPYVSAFRIYPHQPFTQAWDGWMVLRFVFDLLVDVLYCVDMWLRAQTYFFSSKGDIVLDKAAVRRRYIRGRGPANSFAVDFVATVPPLLSELIALLASGDAWKSWVTLRWLLLLRAPRLVNSTGKVLRACMTIFNFSPGVVAMMRLVTLFGVLLLVSHWSACALFVINVRSNELFYTEMLDENLDPNGSAYVYSLYYAFLAILGNDVKSHSRLLSVAMLFVGAGMVATIFGNMTVLVSNSDAQSRAHYEKLERVKQGLARMEIKPELQSRVVKYYEYMWRRQKSGTDNDRLGSFITELPLALKAEIQLHLHEQLVLTVPFFKGCDRLFLQDIVAALRGRVYGPGDNIMTEGDQGKEMFFLEAGQVQVIKATPDGIKVMVELGKGNFFGEMALLEKNGKRSAGILATTFCDVQVLSKKDFDEIMEEWPEYLPRFMAVLLQRKEDMKKREEADKTAGAGAKKVEVEFDVRRKRVGAAAFKNAGKSIIASNKFAALKAGGKGAALGRTLSGSKVKPEPSEGGGGVSLGALSNALRTDSSGKDSEPGSPAPAKPAAAAGGDDKQQQQRLTALERAVGGLDAKMSEMQEALERQTTLLTAAKMEEIQAALASQTELLHAVSEHQRQASASHLQTSIAAAIAADATASESPARPAPPDTAPLNARRKGPGAGLTQP